MAARAAHRTETHGAVEVMQAGTQQVKLGVESTTRAGASLRGIIQTSEAAGANGDGDWQRRGRAEGATEEISASVEGDCGHHARHGRRGEGVGQGGA
jgi:methyl-accepting chemotaxis protein